MISFLFGQLLKADEIKLEDKNIAKGLLKILESYVGSNRTIVFPSFTANNFLKSNQFDIKLSLPKESGVIPIHALKSKNYYKLHQLSYH